jgi:mannose-6-phosphate isomerase-like protein (cupin superfamily)
MTIRRGLAGTGILLSVAWTAAFALQRAAPVAPAKPGGYILERDAEVRASEPGPHSGGGQTTAYSFFKKAPGLTLVFRKRAMKPGSAIGYHLQTEDEIYYILSGKGSMTIDNKTFDVGPGDAILTRTSSSHGLKQVGSDDLVLMINYEQAPQK